MCSIAQIFYIYIYMYQAIRRAVNVLNVSTCIYRITGYLCGTIFMWHYIYVALYLCGTIFMWHYIYVALYLCGTIFMWHYIYVNMLVKLKAYKYNYHNLYIWSKIIILWYKWICINKICIHFKMAFLGQNA